jgi:hypothetical protein
MARENTARENMAIVFQDVLKSQIALDQMHRAITPCFLRCHAILFSGQCREHLGLVRLIFELALKHQGHPGYKTWVRDRYVSFSNSVSGLYNLTVCSSWLACINCCAVFDYGRLTYYGHLPDNHDLDLGRKDVELFLVTVGKLQIRMDNIVADVTADADLGAAADLMTLAHLERLDDLACEAPRDLLALQGLQDQPLIRPEPELTDLWEAVGREAAQLAKERRRTEARVAITRLRGTTRERARVTELVSRFKEMDPAAIRGLVASLISGKLLSTQLSTVLALHRNWRKRSV